MEIIFSSVLLVLKYLEILSRPIYWYVYRGKRKRVPPMVDELLKVSATSLAAKIRKKEVSSEEVVGIYIKRIREVNLLINAIVENRFEDALQEARNVDQYLSKSSMSQEDLEKTKPLLGVPFTVKESCSVEGMDLTSGLLSRSGIKADSDGKIVARLRAAGAIPLLVSNTPELCRDFECNNYVTGRTNNPYDTTCTSGGSSGGEGALLGAGASVIGVGSDIAGSIRVPGCFNGVFGHKPTPRIATIKGHFPYVQDEKYPDFLVIGPMTRYAEDLKLVMNIIADPQQKPFLRLNEKVNTRKLNIFFMEDAGSFVLPTVQSEIKTAVRRAVEYLNKHCGATIKDKKFTEIKDSIEVCATDLYTMKDIPNPLKGDGADNAFFVLCEFVKSVMGKSKYTPNLITSFIQEKALKSFVGDHSLDKIKWRHNFVNTLGDNGVFIFPTIPSRATKHNKSILTAGFAAYVVMPNSLGLPSTSVPCGLDRKGMPIGIQVIAAPNQDRLCLAVAEELEKCFGGWVPP